MSEYKPYGKEKTLPNRKTRKGVRNSAFMFNKLAARKLREQRAEKRREQDEVEQS